MIRLNKLTDYGFVLLSHFAWSDGETWLTARDLSQSTGLPLPTVSKLLKLLSKHGILSAQRGIYGGYRLAHKPKDVHVLNVIELIDGPIAITDCACGTGGSGECAIEAHCPTKPQWQRITERIRAALSDITLLEMAGPSRAEMAPGGCGGTCAPQPNQPCQCGHDESLHTQERDNELNR